MTLAGGYLTRFSDEFPASVDHAGPAGPYFDAAALVGLGLRRSGLLARHRSSIDGTPRTEDLPDRTHPLGNLEMGVLGPVGRLTFAGHADLRLRGENVSASQLYGTAVMGPFGLWFGRRVFGFGASDGGSVVLHSDVPFDGVGAFLTDGVRLPGPLSVLGLLRAETHVSRMERSGAVESPFIFTLRVALRPHPRFGVGLNRGAFFGGTGELVPPATFGRILKVITGIDTAQGRENFEDHVASMDFWFLPPLGHLPLMLYGEWGSRTSRHSAARCLPS
jgi:hypothetical protein